MAYQDKSTGKWYTAPPEFGGRSYDTETAAEAAVGGGSSLSVSAGQVVPPSAPPKSTLSGGGGSAYPGTDVPIGYILPPSAPSSDSILLQTIEKRLEQPQPLRPAVPMPQINWPAFQPPQINWPTVTPPAVPQPEVIKPPGVEGPPQVEGITAAPSAEVPQEKLPEGVRKGAAGFESTIAPAGVPPSVDELVKKYRDVFGAGTEDRYVRQYLAGPQFQGKILQGTIPLWMRADPLWRQFLRTLGLAVDKRLGHGDIGRAESTP